MISLSFLYLFKKGGGKSRALCLCFTLYVVSLAGVVGL
jgi:hypothetical protein